MAYLEIGGGALLIAGIATRQLCLLFLPILLGALLVHAGNGWVFSNPNGGWEFVAFLIVVTVVQAILGSGAFAFRSGNKHRVSTALVADSEPHDIRP